MKKILILLVIAIMFLATACSKKNPENFVLVKGGNFINKTSNDYDKNERISNFYIGKYEVTQKEWLEIMDSNPSNFKGDNLPVEMVSWYDCIDYCNKRSIKEGLNPYYNIDKEVKDTNNKSFYDDVRWTVSMNEDANGYRLPTEAEWEYAASGGQESKNYIYSGENNADEVSWYWRNAGNMYLSGDWNWSVIEHNKNTTKEIGGKKSNELGIYDMSGNVREWCFDWYQDPDIEVGTFRVWKGGGWIGDVSCCESSYRGKFEANGKGADQGFRLCRNE